MEQKGVIYILANPSFFDRCAKPKRKINLTVATGHLFVFRSERKVIAQISKQFCLQKRTTQNGWFFACHRTIKKIFSAVLRMSLNPHKIS